MPSYARGLLRRGLGTAPSQTEEVRGQLNFHSIPAEFGDRLLSDFYGFATLPIGEKLLGPGPLAKGFLTASAGFGPAPVTVCAIGLPVDALAEHWVALPHSLQLGVSRGCLHSSHSSSTTRDTRVFLLGR